MSPSTIAQFKPTLEDACNLIITQKQGNCLPICVSLPADLLTPVAAYLKLTNGAQCRFEISSSASDQTIEGVESFLLESVVAGSHHTHYSFLGSNHMVQGFPFNRTSSPMYNGSTLCFLGTALSYQSPAWVILTGLVYLVYQVALKYEELSQDLLPFKNEATPY
ncbi:hypothetical protein PCANC_10542 [Puccinia coronata f. sp. avenae]|uniref:phosphatidyl-N-methylethanolamine N-methyltransferase n=1 Tax=Puccinia coronata f. sp. avenae TaxID=200324 RepID=A0A2N5VZ48_9BASI|nr:hypothetical protein PCANC_10542 [Puccinia coronata f. sp. avenae]